MSVTRSTMLSLITASAVVIGLASASPADASDTRFFHFQVVIDDTGVEPALLKVRQGDRISIRNESEREQRAKVVRNYDLMDDSPIKPNTLDAFRYPRKHEARQIRRALRRPDLARELSRGRAARGTNSIQFAHQQRDRNFHRWPVRQIDTSI